MQILNPWYQVPISVPKYNCGYISHCLGAIWLQTDNDRHQTDMHDPIRAIAADGVAFKNHCPPPLLRKSGAAHGINYRSKVVCTSNVVPIRTVHAICNQCSQILELAVKRFSSRSWGWHQSTLVVNFLLSCLNIPMMGGLTQTRRYI